MPFKKGKSGNPRGRKEGTKVAPEFLRDLRHVYGSNKPPEGSEPESPGRAMLRELKEKDPARFLERLQRAEREWAAAKQGVVQESAESKAAVEEEDDPGTMAALALVEKVLKGVLDAKSSAGAADLRGVVPGAAGSEAG